jgi:hypothetical protein
MQATLAILLLTQTLAGAAPQRPEAEAAPDLAQPAPPVTPPALTDELIRKAVRETVAEDPRPVPVNEPNAGAFRAGDAASARMSAAFEQAKVPNCLHDEALKLQPAMIGPFQVVGPYSLPWVVAAIARGKCHF